MNRPVKSIKGVGTVKAKALNEIGIKNIGDLLYYLPRRHLDRSVTESASLTIGSHMTLIIRVVNSYLAHGRRSRLLVHCHTLKDESLTLVFFKSHYYFKDQFKTDQHYIVSGKLDYYRGVQMSHPDFELLDGDDEHNLLHVGRIVPLYPSTDALKKNYLDSRGFRRLIAAAFEDNRLNLPEIIPDELIKKYNLTDRFFALKNIHFPEDYESLEKSRTRLIYEELFLFHYMMYHRRLQREKIKRELKPLPFGESPSYNILLKKLPFKLTGDQLKAIEDILNNCQANHSDAFLLQGDVGSGKTVAALAVILHYIDNGIQTALMAPTEVLARQHFRTLSEFIGITEKIQLELITGQGRKKQKLESLDRIKRGESNLVIGTHSLIEEAVEFDELGLVIIDEQHRFGVEQRDILRRKGKNPDMLVMTATPIPRTLCLTGFADLNLITLLEKPAGRKPIKTMWLQENRRRGLYKSITNHVSDGRQCFIVYPVIDESEKLDLRAATSAFEDLSANIFPQFNLELLHGRMKSPDKDRIMNDFRAGKTQILVTTTVIEVGVDVPNATIMVIEHAERFGISQLHQLRGRVGRGSEESFCVLMTDDEITDDASRRLQAVENSHDGFYLSEIDMDIRGPGELLGLRQHGLPGFRLADLVRDCIIAENAYQDAREYQEITEDALNMIRSQFSEGITVFPAYATRTPG